MRAAELRGAVGAVAFLTRVPVGRLLEIDTSDLGRASLYFPLVGAGVGAATGGVADALAGTLGAPLAAILGVATGAILTGALHLDALADTADALAARTREAALAIMRDHAIGVYGTVALVLGLAVNVAALASLAEHGHALRFAVCACALARAVPVALSHALPYARSGDGLGRALTSGGRLRAAVAAAIAAGICVLLGGAWLIPAAFVVLVAVGLAAQRKLGGVTGDVLGAAAELSELAALVVAVRVA